MSRAYTIANGVVVPGVQVIGGEIRLGESGRGRKLTCVPVPPHWDAGCLEGGVLCNIPPPDCAAALVLVRDHSGYRGRWYIHNAEGTRTMAQGYCAQGDAGRMGGGPEYLLKLNDGGSFSIRREGRLYGAPPEIRISNTGGVVTAVDVRKEADAAEAESNISDAFGGADEVHG